MNVIILTPDRVGSTLLQRLITIYMQFHSFDRPVINLHELTNGLIKYYSDIFNQEVLGKGGNWGYHQTLPEIQAMLESVTHYKTSRLAQYHIRNREDSIADQVGFYKYINDNFFVIAAQRENLLEHALSWCITNHSKRLNVYSIDEKFDTFANIYKNKITVARANMIKYLNWYKKYLTWVDNHFSVNSYFVYDQHLGNIEDYILNLEIFNNQPVKKTWHDTFNIGFKDWNTVHYHISDLSGINNQLDYSQQDLLRIGMDPNIKLDVSKLEIQPAYNKQQRLSTLSPALQKFMSANLDNYWQASNHLNELVEHKILVTNVPHKLQTMLEKKLLIKNFKECVQVYNEWVGANGIGKIYPEEELSDLISNEVHDWHIKPMLTSIGTNS
jgi:hypothetical protein